MYGRRYTLLGFEEVCWSGEAHAKSCGLATSRRIATMTYFSVPLVPTFAFFFLSPSLCHLLSLRGFGVKEPAKHLPPRFGNWVFGAISYLSGFVGIQQRLYFSAFDVFTAFSSFVG